jgi:hypothetical protein
MRRLKPRPRTLMRLAALGAAFAVAGGVAYGATSNSLIDTQGNILACVHPGGGKWHIWPAGHVCTGSWQPVTVASTGKAGAAGPKGATGPRGATGPSGPVNAAASSVNGVTPAKLSLRIATPATGTATTTLYAADGLTIVAGCTSSGAAVLEANGPSTANAGLTVSGYDSTGNYGSQTAALGSASAAPLGPAGSGSATFEYTDTSSQVVTGRVGYLAAPSVGAYAGCSFFGKVAAS